MNAAAAAQLFFIILVQHSNQGMASPKVGKSSRLN